MPYRRCHLYAQFIHWAQPGFRSGHVKAKFPMLWIEFPCPADAWKPCNLEYADVLPLERLLVSNRRSVRSRRAAIEE